MALEDLTGTSKFISALNPAWPVDDDWVDEGDNHIRGIKNVLRNTFPALDGPVTLTDEQMNGVLVAAPESRIINGNFAIDQRNAGAAKLVNTATGTYTLDRWAGYAVNASGTYSMQRFPENTEFLLRLSIGTADATLAAGDYYAVGQTIEGHNVADMNFGLAGSDSFTFACDIWSTVAGTFPISFSNAAATQSYVTTVALTAGVWVAVLITVPGPTAGVWQTGNGSGVFISLGLGVGSTFQAPAINTWQAGAFYTAAGCTNFMANAGATMQIKRVRLYPGSIDYGPCQRLYADELRLCQRYYCKTFQLNTAPANGTGYFDAIYGSGITSGNTEPFLMWYYPVQMRASPSVTLYNPRSGGLAGQWTDGTVDSGNARVVLLSEVRALIDNQSVMLPAQKWAIAATASAEL